MELFFALFLLLLAAGLLVAVLFLVAVGALGLLSASLLVGLHRRSVGSGLKTLVLLSSSAGGMMTGTFLLFFSNSQARWQIPTSQVLVLGLGSGLAAGLMIGMLTYAALRALLRRGLHRLQRR